MSCDHKRSVRVRLQELHQKTYDVFESHVEQRQRSYPVMVSYHDVTVHCVDCSEQHTFEDIYGSDVPAWARAAFNRVLQLKYTIND